MDEVTYDMHLIKLDDRAVYRWNSKEYAFYHVDFSFHKDEFNRRGCPGQLTITIKS